ncbi:MAG: hypothetical protein P8Q15_02200 [Methylophilaceae bacterium]|nr:hypothetical protein [Methylophilaceae bacterium]
MKLYLMIALCFLTLSANAQASRFQQYINQPYALVRAGLMSEGWQTMTNSSVQESSLYAQDVYAQGYVEVLNCISMERDQCQFVFSKNKQRIVVTTKEKAFNVESIAVAD